MKRPTQRQVEKAWRIRLLARGGTVPNATPAERAAALKRTQAAQQRRRDLEATDE
jgi:hypothetical protein